MERERDDEIDGRRRTPSVFFYLLYLVPLVVVMVLSSGSRIADPRARAGVLLGAGLGGYAFLFLLLVFLLPRLLKERGRPDLGRRWQYAALRASPGSSMLTVLWTILSMPIGSLGVRAAAGALAAAAVFAAVLRVSARAGPAR